MSELIAEEMFYYAVFGFVAALFAAVWMFRDSRSHNIDDAWISFLATLGPLVALPGAVLAGGELIGSPLVGPAQLDVLRSLIWLSIAGGVGTLLAASYYALILRGSTHSAPNIDDSQETMVGGTPISTADYGAGDKTRGPSAAAGEGYAVGEANANETVIINREGAVDGVIGWLTYLTDPHRGTELPLGRDAFIGRENACEIVIDDPEVSGRHARIQISDDDEFVIRDVGSTNGTYVNDEEIDVHVLSDHDTIRIGSTKFEFFWVQQRPDVASELAYRGSLLISAGESRGDTVAVNQDKLIIGSSDHCDLTLSDDGISEVHAMISRDGEDYIIKAVSTGVSVNGNDVDEKTLEDRDEIVIGEARMLYRDGVSE